MELSPDHLDTAARRWDAVAAELGEAVALLRRSPVAGLGPAAGEATLLLEAAEAAVSRLREEADRVVDGLLVTARSVADVDREVAAALSRPGGAAG